MRDFVCPVLSRYHPFLRLCVGSPTVVCLHICVRMPVDTLHPLWASYFGHLVCVFVFNMIVSTSCCVFPSLYFFFLWVFVSFDVDNV